VRAVIYHDPNNTRSKIVCAAMMQGILENGDDPVSVRFQQWRGETSGHVAVMYGAGGRRKAIQEAYQEAGKHSVYIDLGYWRRKEGHGMQRWRGYHKIVADGLHPIRQLKEIGDPGPGRFQALGIPVSDWRDGDAILVAGMSGKSAATHGMAAETWERAAIEKLRDLTDREIIYRPKPSWPDARPLPGTTYSPGDQPLHSALARAHAVVSHHSNVAVDAIAAGLNIYVEAGAAKPMSAGSMDAVLCPVRRRSKARERLLNALAWCQWNVDEMARGEPWHHLKQQGFI